MKTIKSFKIFAVAMVAIASDDDDLMMESLDSKTPRMTRSMTTTQVVNFDNATEGELAGPTSYGENLYNGDIFGWYEASTGFYTEFNTVSGVQLEYSF